MTTELRRFQLDRAWRLAEKLRMTLMPFTERIAIVGSVRRECSYVKDIELLFIPKYTIKAADLFNDKSAEMHDCADAIINTLVAQGVLAKRLNSLGHETWGKENKHARHVESGIAVDFFATTADNWWNALVIRTGGVKTVLALTTGANKNGLTLHAYGDGFTNLKTGERIQTHSEREVFERAGVAYLEPTQRP